MLKIACFTNIHIRIYLLAINVEFIRSTVKPKKYEWGRWMGYKKYCPILCINYTFVETIPIFIFDYCPCGRKINA